jgi:hypothetical protein
MEHTQKRSSRLAADDPTERALWGPNDSTSFTASIWLYLLSISAQNCDGITSCQTLKLTQHCRCGSVNETLNYILTDDWSYLKTVTSMCVAEVIMSRRNCKRMKNIPRKLQVYLFRQNIYSLMEKYTRHYFSAHTCIKYTLSTDYVSYKM